MMNEPKSPAERQTVIEEGTRLEGSLTSSCAIVVNGAFDGDVTAPSLRVNPAGSVHGKVKVDRIGAAGEVSGTLEADFVELSGTVRDDTILRTKSLEVKLEPGASVAFGACTLEVGEMPDKEAVIRRAMSREEVPATTSAAPAEAAPPPPEPIVPALAEAADVSGAFALDAGGPVKRKTTPAQRRT
jgi:cytoskeletal protein CcmA (bactofilin family)